MKKILKYFVIVFILTSCYDDYEKDFDYDAVYFTRDVDIRTVVVGEDMKFDFGVVLGGVLLNERDREVRYEIDPSLLESALPKMKSNTENYIKTASASLSSLELLPSDYYTLSDGNKFIIKKGQHVGRVTLRPDSLLFLSDPGTLAPRYALPLTITYADADSVIADKSSTVIGIKYENMLFGNYWHGGITTIKDAAGNTVGTIKYYTSIPSPESKVWNLKTIAPNALAVSAYSDQASQKNEIVLSLNGGNIEISSSNGSTYSYMADGTSTFNRAKLLQNRKIFLNYKYVNSEGYTCYAQDTLTFRNRIRDGVNEWQDENPSHY